MKEVEFIWFNGKIVPWKEASVHFLTHSLHYGTAVFEGIRCYKTEKGPAIFRLEDHVERLFNSAKIAGMKNLPYDKGQIIDAAKEVVKKNNLKECYIRPLFFYGYGKMGLDTVGAKLEAGIAAWPWGAYLGEEGVKNGIRAKVSSISRHHPNSVFSQAKISGAYTNSTLAKMEALDAGYDEAIMLDTNGLVAECTGENIFIVEKGKLLTPERSNVLAGITRDSVIKIAEDQGIHVSECKIKREMLYSADECFITGTAAEITPVREIDNRLVGNGKPGQVTKKIQKLYYNVIHGRDKKFEKWLELV